MQLKTVELTKQYGKKCAVNQVSLTLTSGVYGLLGENGAGKTTLMKLLCGLINPDSGSVFLDDKETGYLGESYRDLLGYLPQQFTGYFDFTAIKFLHYICVLKGVNQPTEKSKELLNAVGLSNVQNQKIKTMSGGMKRRLGIAQALLNDPQILILDEPTAGLDPKERVRFRNLISAYSEGRIVLLSTHIVSDIAYIADEIIMMKAGKIVSAGKPDAILEQLQGRVWEFQVPSNLVADYESRYRINNLKNADGGFTLLRVIADSPPVPDAQQVQPQLEDYYLDSYQGEGQA